MKNITTIIAALVLVTLGINASAQSGNTETASANASATIITPINIVKANDLRFGTIAKTTEGGTVTILAQENLGITYSANDMETTLTERGSAKFNISGEANALFAVLVPETITLESGSNSMVIETSKSLNNNNNTLTGGASTLYVGGTLTVGADQAIGNYSGDFNVTVSYE